MDSIFDYIKWIGSFSFNEVKFNAIDQLILATLCYVKFENFYTGEERLYSIAPRILDGEFSYDKYRVEDDRILLKKASKAKRYRDLVLTTPKANTTTIDSDVIKQFAGICFYDDNTLYICFRGTDATMVGWKEDFNMSFVDAVPADIDGLSYLNEIAAMYPNKDIVITGHSKGGHVATYSYIMVDESIKDRVVACYNNDGPGFGSDELLSRLDDKTHTIIPESSIIGMLMSHSEKYDVVKSSAFFIFQHDPYTWELEGPSFAYTERSGSSIYLDKVIHNWLKDISKEHREFFVDTLFEILGTTKATSFHGFTSKLINNIPQITKRISELKPDDKKMIIYMIKKLVKYSLHTNTASVVEIDQEK